MSRVCFEFRDFGSCKYGQNCRFGHGVGAVAPAPMYPNYGYQDNGMNFPPQQPMRPQQVRVCFDFRDKGNCRYGTNCRYSHDVNQGAGAGDEAYPSFQNNRFANRNTNDRWRRDEANFGQQHFGNNGYNNMRPQGFQRVCFDFRDLGSCRYGPQCKFSHDPNASADGFNRFNGESKFGFNKGPKRRQLCHQFRDTGNCDYGDRCKFSHDLEEARGAEDHQENFYQQADGADAQPAASNDDAADAAAAVPSSDSAPQHELQ